MMVLFLALTATRARAISRQSHFLLERGVDVVLVTTNPDPWYAEHGLDARVQVHALRSGEGRQIVPRAERVLVFRIPRGVFRRLRRLPGRAGAASRAVERRYERAADLFHRKVFQRLYTVFRPYLLWRVARREVLSRIDMAAVTEVVVGDSHAIPLGWHIARANPSVQVSFSLDRSAYGAADQPAAASDV